MVQFGEAEEGKRVKGKISVVVVQRCVLGLPPKPPTPLTPRHYLGKPQTYREAVGSPIIGHVTRLKPVPNCDRWAYLLTQTDFMAPFRPEYARA